MKKKFILHAAIIVLGVAPVMTLVSKFAELLIEAASK